MLANPRSTTTAPSSSSSVIRRSSRAQRARSGEIHTRARREAGTSPVRGQPSTSAAGSTSGRGSNDSSAHAGGLEAVQPEVPDVVARGVEGGDVPALAAVDQRVRLDLPRRELVLVLLVVLERQQPALGDRARDDRGDLGVVATGGGDLEAFVDRVLAERGDDLLAHRGQRPLGDVLADQVDRGHQRLGLDRQQPRRARERVAVRLGIDLDHPVGAELGVQDVRARAEVDEVEHRDVLAQLLVGDLERGAQLAGRRGAGRRGRRRSGCSRASPGARTARGGSRRRGDGRCRRRSPRGRRRRWRRLSSTSTVGGDLRLAGCGARPAAPRGRGAHRRARAGRRCARSRQGRAPTRSAGARSRTG